MRFAYKVVLPIVALFAIGACDDSTETPTSPGDDGPQESSVTGQVRDSESSSSHRSGDVEPQLSTVPQRSVAADATTAAVAEVQSDGSLDVLAEADVEASGRFRIEGVPSGRTDLVVVARSDAGDELGRVIVQGQTRAGVETTVAPIDAETTVEGRTYAHLRASGESEAAANTGELALWVDMNEEAAVTVSSNDAQIEALARAFVEAQAASSRIYADAGTSLDPGARAEAHATLAATYAQSLDAGASAQAATETFMSASLDAMSDAGADAETVALATAGSATAWARASSQAQLDADARLQVVRTAARLNLRARERLAATVSSDFSSEAQATTQALADARADIRTASSVSEIRASVDAVLETSQGVVTDAMLSLASDLSVTARADLEAALEDAYAEADMSAGFEGAASASAIADAAATYRSNVEVAAQAVADAMADSSAAVSTETVIRLLLAAGASGSVT